MSSISSTLKSGFMMMCLKPGLFASELIPATSSYNHDTRSPSCITWLALFILGLAVLPFQSSQMVVAPFSVM